MKRSTLVGLVLFLASCSAIFARPLSIAPAPPLPPPSSTAEFDLLDCRLTVTLFPERGLIEGRAVLWGRHFGASPHIPFFLHSRALLQRVCLPKGPALAVKRDGNRVWACLPSKPRYGAHAGLVVEWALKLGGPSAEGPVCPYLTRDGVFLPSDLCWHPRGIGTDKATWKLNLKIPRHWKGDGMGVEARGFMASGKRCLRFRFDEPIAAMAFFGGPYEVRGRRAWWNGWLRSLVYPRSSSVLPEHLVHAGQYLTFFRGLFGDPVFHRFTLIELAGRPRRGQAFRIAAEDNVLAVSAPPDVVAGPYLEFLATELARFWFERRIRFRDHLGEALCVYCGMLALRKFHGREHFLESARDKAAVYRNASMHGRDARPAGIVGLGENVQAGTYRVLTRCKIPLLLSWLEQACGGVKEFVRILRMFIRHHRGGSPVGWPEFIDVFEKRSGVDLSNFALLYVDGLGIPPDMGRVVGYDVPEDPPAREGEKQ